MYQFVKKKSLHLNMTTRILLLLITLTFGCVSVVDSKPPRLVSVYNDASTRYDLIGSSSSAKSSSNSANYAYQVMDLMSNEIQPLEQRPLYNIAHMANSIRRTSDALNRGANGVEIDVNFDRDDIYLYHGYPCDCFRYCWEQEKFSDYLRFIRQIATPGSEKYDPRMTILYFDFKLTPYKPMEKYYHGIRFGDLLAKHLFVRSPVRISIRLICSISYLADANFVRGLVYRLRELNLFDDVKGYLGFDIGMEMDFDKSESLWSELNVTNVWQGEGITNCFNPIMASALEKLVKERNRPRSKVKKVYRWTVDLTDSIKSILQYGIDGIMTNHPERVQKIVAQRDFAAIYRLANGRDNPFVKHSHTTGDSGQEESIKLDKIVQAGGRIANSIKMVNFLQDLRDSVFFFIYEIVGSIL